MSRTSAPAANRASRLWPLALRLAPYALVFLACLVRLNGLTFQSLWRDEVDAICFAQAPLLKDLPDTALSFTPTCPPNIPELLAAFTQPGFNGPLFFLILRGAIGLFGYSEFALRFFSLLCGVISVALIITLGTRLFNRAVGLIAAALPQARIIHIRRQPVDACYAIYKTLFRMGYPFSYDLQDLGRYWLAYDRLMAHWRRLLPADRFLEVHYEDLVANQEAVSRRLVMHAGLPWQDACLAFERNSQPSLTASAAQVRQPIYNSSVGLWRHYENELAPLVAVLREAGIALDQTTAGNPT